MNVPVSSIMKCLELQFNCFHLMTHESPWLGETLWGFESVIPKVSLLQFAVNETVLPLENAHIHK